MILHRWLWIPAMAPLMWGLWLFVLSADKLHQWKYAEFAPRPTAADYTYAAVAFWTSVLLPVVVGGVMAVLALRRRYAPKWPFLEMGIVASPFIVLGLGYLSETFVLIASLSIGGTVVLGMLNLGASLCHRKWGRTALSFVVASGGELYLLWLSYFIIYIDT